MTKSDVGADQVNQSQLIAQIRFHLSSLRDRNEHHSFEHLCRQFARIRICSNILPATGPVAAGGDQGRDFETFRTYLQDTILADHTFVGAGSSDEMIAFACTTQQYESGLPTKIISDVSKIMSSGTLVDSIYFFCTEPVPAAKRHELEARALKDHNIELWIIDLEALAEQLADPQTFHIASEHLDIPADLFPKPTATDSDEWYRAMKADWSDTDRNPYTYRDFTELKLAIREASHDEQLYPDVPFWAGRLRELFSDLHPIKLKLQAIYEVAVGLLLSQKNMISESENLAYYFDTIINIPDDEVAIDLLNDASVLLTFASVAVNVHHVNLCEADIVGWHEGLLAKVDRILSSTSSANLRCELLQAKAQLFVIESFEEGHYPGDKAFEVWIELAEAAESAPLFPLERFADFLTKSVPILGEHPSYRSLSQRIDALLIKRVGSRAAAEKCRERATAFASNGNIQAALSELHDTKVKWYSRETIVPSLLSIMSISGFYEELGLLFAAKQYALATASLAYWSDVPEARKIVSSALAQVAVLEYELGNWSNVAPTSELAVKAHAEFVGDFSDDRGGRIEASLQLSAFVLAALEAAGLEFPRSENFEFPALNHLGISEYQAEASTAISKQGLDGLREMASEDLRGYPFGDLHEVVETTWMALGVNWHISWSNDFKTSIAAEHILATLQVLIADLSREDLHVLPSAIHLTIRMGQVSVPEFSRDVHDRVAPWTVTLPDTDDGIPQWYNEDDNHLLALCFEMIRRISVLPHQNLEAIVEQSFKYGVSNKLFVAKPYSDLYLEFRTQKDFDALPRISTHEGLLPLFFPKEHPELAKAIALSPLYSQDKSHRAIRKRYQHVQDEIPVTLTRLKSDDNFRVTVASLRERGWKDWHILQAVANVFFNFHTHDWMQEGIHPHEISKRIGQLRSDRTELTRLEVSTPVPLSEFSAERLEFMLHASIGATMKGWGLVLYDEKIEVTAIVDFMGERFNFWKDDVEHADPFAPPPPGIILPQSVI